MLGDVRSGAIVSVFSAVMGFARPTNPRGVGRPGVVAQKRPTFGPARFALSGGTQREDPQRTVFLVGASRSEPALVFRQPSQRHARFVEHSSLGSTQETDASGDVRVVLV